MFAQSISPTLAAVLEKRFAGGTVAAVLGLAVVLTTSTLLGYEPPASIPPEADAGAPGSRAADPDGPAAPAAEIADEEAEAGFPLLDQDPVKQITNVDFPDRREGHVPDWLESESWSEGGSAFQPVTTKVQLTRAKALNALDDRIRQVADNHVDRLVGSSGAARSVGFRIEELTDRCLAEEPFVERVVGTHGTTWRAHALLEFDESFENDVAQRWRQITAQHRLLQTGFGAGFVLLMLGTLFGYFKLDTATRGYYSARLQFATAGTILALVAASVLLAKWWGQWM